MMRRAAGTVSSAAVYGAPLTESSVEFILKCFAAVEKHVTVDGVYRITGHLGEIASLKANINKGKKVDLDQLDVHNLACITKAFFSELPEPLFTFALYESLLGAIQQQEGDVKGVIFTLLDLLPPLNLRLLATLMAHLQFVSSKKSQNRMDIMNLAIVFGPILLRPRVDSIETILADVAFVNRFIMLLIDQHEYFFKSKIAKLDKTSPSDSPVVERVVVEKCTIDSDSNSPTMKKRSEKEEKKQREKNVKKFNQQWESTVRERSGSNSPPWDGKEKKSRKEKKEEKLQQKERKKRQNQINESWTNTIRSTNPDPTPLTPGLTKSAKKAEERAALRRRMEAAYQEKKRQRVSMWVVRVDRPNVTVKERAERIQSGFYNPAELEVWLQDLAKSES